MALQRLSLRVRQTINHARALHSTSICQQQEALIDHSYPDQFSIFRSPEHDPASQTENHIGQFYTVPASHMHTLFPHGLPPRYQQQIKTFNESCVMIRQPALEVISYLKQADYTKPALRYIFCILYTVQVVLHLSIVQLSKSLPHYPKTNPESRYIFEQVLMLKVNK
ncbi:28S ribosomal protein S29, mitochondrial-like [Boleophthalmus pectinirostris]|uniref:28S ribosomal protein S29, mitochondrial-like n=1 Tax=Boleophthalmus pectinirostris TaxID=150288 RepID=UPI00242D79CD|nr:28S ribosomal protein S29, mitochondrial-like [Boleophthalmus pectinirostris]